MRTIKMRRGVLLGLAVAAGTLATAPIAGADDTPVFTIVDDTPVPALTDLVTPTVGYDNQFTIGLGSTEETFITQWDGTGAPTTTEVTVEFHAVDGRTEMVMTHVGIPSDSPGATGWTMALDKLAAYVSTRSDR